MDNSLLIPVGGVAFVLLLINIRFAFSMMSAQRQRTEDLKLERETEVNELKREMNHIKEKNEKDLDEANKRHRRCERITQILIWTLQQNKIEVPAAIWQEGG